MQVPHVSLLPNDASKAAHRPALTPELVCFIYALCGPRDGKIRYVGITRQTVQKRLSSHLRAARGGKQFHVSRWLRQLLNEGLRPIIVVLETTADTKREVFWIEKCRAEGCNLTNSTSGGLSDYFHSPEAIQKIAAAGEKRFKDLSGQVIGRLTVLEIESHRPLKWRCECSCGKIAVIAAQSFSGGKVQSCGCWSRELAAQRARNRARHGLWQSKEYLTWIEMRARCNNSKHARYDVNGARGIRVCARWQDGFEPFLQDMGNKPPGTVLMRKDRFGPYDAENCIWATRSELRKGDFKR